MSADGWPPTDWASTRTRPCSFGLGRDTACPSSRTWVQLYNWVQTLLQLATRSGCSGSPSLLIWVLTVTCPFFVSATSIHSLRQLRRVRRSLDTESTATLVHAFVTSRLDYCNILLVGSPKTVIDKMQRVINAAVRIVSGTRKYDRGLTQLLHAELH